MEDEYGFRQKLKGRTVSELIERFNKEVGNRGWVRARSFFLEALEEALLATGLDCSDFIKEGSMSCQYPIALAGNRIVQVKGGGEEDDRDDQVESSDQNERSEVKHLSFEGRFFELSLEPFSFKVLDGKSFRPVKLKEADLFEVMEEGMIVDKSKIPETSDDFPKEEVASLSSRFQEAMVYASQLHATQFRKGSKTPYVSHLLGVAGIVLENGGTEDEAIAALLHDAIEDQGGAPTRDEIRNRFGDVVVDIVNGCTDAETIPKPPWKDRKVTYIAHLATASPSVLLVSMADKLHNARSILADYRSIGESLWPRFTGGKEGTLWYYRSLITEFQKRGLHSALVAELDRVVSELERMV